MTGGVVKIPEIEARMTIAFLVPGIQWALLSGRQTADQIFKDLVVQIY